MGSPEMDGLIVRHLVDIEEAGKRAFVLDAEVFKALAKTAEKWTAKTAWEGDSNIDEDNLWLAPLKWKLAGETEEGEADWLADFHFSAGGDDDDFFKLTRLCQARNGKFGFRWKSDHYGDGRRVAWRNFIRDNAEDIIRETGFEYEKNGTFFPTVTLNAEALANAIEQDAIEDALGPFETALDNLTRTEPTFTRLLEAAKTHFQP